MHVRLTAGILFCGCAACPSGQHDHRLAHVQLRRSTCVLCCQPEPCAASAGEVLLPGPHVIQLSSAQLESHCPAKPGVKHVLLGEQGTQRGSERCQIFASAQFYYGEPGAVAARGAIVQQTSGQPSSCTHRHAWSGTPVPLPLMVSMTRVTASAPGAPVAAGSRPVTICTCASG